MPNDAKYTVHSPRYLGDAGVGPLQLHQSHGVLKLASVLALDALPLCRVQVGRYEHKATRFYG